MLVRVCRVLARARVVCGVQCCDHAPRSRGAVCCADLGGVAFNGCRANRQTHLARKYRFTCECACCTLTGVALERSEARQQRMHQLWHEIDELYSLAASAARTPGVVTRLADELCQLSAAEGRPAIWQRAALIAAMQDARASGDGAAALAWAARGARDATVALGADAPTALKFESVVRAWTRALANGDALQG